MHQPTLIIKQPRLRMKQPTLIMKQSFTGIEPEVFSNKDL